MGLAYRYLEQTKAAIDRQQQRSYASKLALHNDMAELLTQREDELRYRTSLLCVSLFDGVALALRRPFTD